MKLVNPLYYPLAVLAGAIALPLGIRLLRIPPWLTFPAAAAIATATAAWRGSNEPPEAATLGNPELDRELQSVRQQAQLIAEKANALRAEAAQLLSEVSALELLATVQYACDRAAELPAAIDEMARRLHGEDSLFSVEELQQQLNELERQQSDRTGVAREQLDKVAGSLRQNIELARQGRDARQAQVLSLSSVVLDAAAALQSLQNQLRTADLSDAESARQLQLLSRELGNLRETVELMLPSAT